MRKVLYPGSFNPITKGHMDIIEQASSLFDEIVVAVMSNPLKKSCLFSLKERQLMIDEIYKNIDNVKVIIGSGAAVDVAAENNCQAIVRGFRGLSDFDYEMQIAQVNRDITDGKINTVCLLANPELVSVSSSAVREIFNLGKDVSKYVDDIVLKSMLKKRGFQNE